MINWFKKYMLSLTTRALELHAFIVFTALSLWGHYVPSLRWYGYAAAGVFAAWKEFWFDPKYEGAAIRWSGVIDFAGYCAGLGLVALVWLT